MPVPLGANFAPDLTETRGARATSTRVGACDDDEGDDDVVEEEDEEGEVEKDECGAVCLVVTVNEVAGTSGCEAAAGAVRFLRAPVPARVPMTPLPTEEDDDDDDDGDAVAACMGALRRAKMSFFPTA